MTPATSLDMFGFSLAKLLSNCNDLTSSANTTAVVSKGKAVLYLYTFKKNPAFSLVFKIHF